MSFPETAQPSPLCPRPVFSTDLSFHQPRRCLRRSVHAAIPVHTLCLGSIFVPVLSCELVHEENCISSGLVLHKVSVNTCGLRKVVLATAESSEGGGGLYLCEGRAVANGGENTGNYFKILEKERVASEVRRGE